MANSVESLIKQLEEVKINDDCFLGKDLFYEKNFFGKDRTKNRERNSRFWNFLFFQKKVNGLVFWDTVDEWKNCKRFVVKNWLVNGWTFFKKKWAARVRWCSKYLLNRRSVNYHKDKQEFKKTEIVEFYWFNSSPNRFDKKTSFSPFALCNCMHCYFFMNWFFRNKNE